MSDPSSSQNDNKSTTTTNNNTCQVCGDSASIVNYGALTCPSCRTFFRRNGSNTKDVAACRLSAHCDITKSTRKHCTACRLAKCLAVGMSSDFIRKEELTGTKRKFTTSHSQEFSESKTTMTISQLSALNTRQDGCQLNSSDLTIISNIVHAFDTFSPVAKVRRTMEIVTTSAASNQFDLSQTLQILSSFANCLVLFISSTPDFQVLTTSEQWSLLQRNMFGLLSIGGMYLMRESGIFDKPENEMAVVPLYGNEIVQQARVICQQLDGDAILVKLMLIALAFSSNCFTKDDRGNFDKDSLLFGTFRLFGSQNVYVELLWKYLNHRYDYREAVQRFSNLIKWLLDSLKLLFEIYETNATYQQFIDNLIQQAERSTAINEQTIIPLWGKS